MTSARISVRWNDVTYPIWHGTVDPWQIRPTRRRQSMTYASTVGAEGAAADAAVERITTVSENGKRAASGNALGAAWDADIAAAKPPAPPLTKTLAGATNPGVSIPKVGPLHIVRAFNPGQAAAVPAGIPVIYSNDANRANEYLLANPSTATINMWVADFSKNVRDDADSWVAILHEEDTPAHGGDYNRWAHCYAGLRVVVDEVNATRKHKIRTLSITTGMPWGNNTYQHWDSEAADDIGVDNYSRQHYATIDQHARDLGKRWLLPEWGLDASHAAPSTNAQAYIAAMDADWPQIKGKAAGACWFYSGRNDLSNLPTASAHLKALIAG